MKTGLALTFNCETGDLYIGKISPVKKVKKNSSYILVKNGKIEIIKKEAYTDVKNKRKKRN